MARIDISNVLILGLTAICAIGIAGQALGFLPSSSEALLRDPAPANQVAAATQAAPVGTRPLAVHLDKPSPTGTRVFDALRSGFGFDASS